jgi:hypothetical protein
LKTTLIYGAISSAISAIIASFNHFRALATKKKEVVRAVGNLVCNSLNEDLSFYSENDPENPKVSLIKSILAWVNPSLVSDLACKEENNAFGLYFKHSELSLDEVSLRNVSSKETDD